MEVPGTRDDGREPRPEEAIARSEAACAIAFDNTSDMIALFSVHPHGELIAEALNRAFVEHLERQGLTPALHAIVGRDVRRALAAIGQDAQLIEYTVRTFLTAVSSKTPIRGEHEAHTPKGPIVVEEEVRPVLDPAGDVSHVLWVSRDVTEQRRTEQALRESEERYRHVFENSADLLYLLQVQPDGRFLVLEVNPAVERSTGRSREELVGRHTDETVGPGQAPRTERALRRAAATGVPAEDEIVLDMPAGRRVYHSEIVPTRDETGRITRLVGVTHDVTEYARMQDALKEAARNVRGKDLEIRRAYADVIASVTGDKLVLVTPEEMGAELGRPVTPPASLCTPADLAPARRAVADALRENAPCVGDPSDILPAVSEALTNALAHAGCGEYRVYVHDGSAQVAVSDAGPGIDFKTLPKATLLAGYSTKRTLGMGFTIMLETADQVLLSTGPEGTTVMLEFGERVGECADGSRR